MSSARGKRRRPRPRRLHEKLRQIRDAYNLSQSEMVNRLGLSDELHPAEISSFEREPENKWSREPALPYLLRYARIAGVAVDVLIDDELDLPEKLAPDPSHGIVRTTKATAIKPPSKTRKKKTGQ